MGPKAPQKQCATLSMYPLLYMPLEGFLSCSLYFKKGVYEYGVEMNSSIQKPTYALHNKIAAQMCVF